MELLNQNSNFDMLFTLEIFNRNKIEGKIGSLVSKIKLGNLHLVMIPGEPFPGLLEDLYAQYPDEIFITISPQQTPSIGLDCGENLLLF